MRGKAAKDGVTLRVIAGTHSVLLAFDLDKARQKDCLGFSVERTDLESGERRWLPNMIKFAADTSKGWLTTARAPLQSFRWGDYTTEPNRRYRYRVVARHGRPEDIVREGLAAEAAKGGDPLPGGVSVEVRTEDTAAPGTAVFFNRGAAASKAYNDKFGDTDPGNNPVAQVWLSRGLEEALLDFLSKAQGPDFALHACIYEFQKPNLLDALAAAKRRRAEVKVVYHARSKIAGDHKDDHAERHAAGAANEDNDEASSDDTRVKNVAAIKTAGLDKLLGRDLVPRQANPQGAIMHDKFVVLLEGGKPKAVWTGSTNWTAGALYGQLNVGHAVYDERLASLYEESFAMLAKDEAARDTKQANGRLTAVPQHRDAIPHGASVVFSPQDSLDMIDLYAEICAQAKLLFVSAPFLLHEKIRNVLSSPSHGALRYVMADKAGSFGPKGSIELLNGDPGRVGTVATLLKTPLNDFQGKLLEGRESFHHPGVHIHTKIILADPLGTDPILVTGSANFSNGSTRVNDSNSLIFRGDTGVADIYATEFMRMFQHYWFRFKESQAKADPKTGEVLSLDTGDDWQQKFFKPSTTNFLDRLAFIG